MSTKYYDENGVYVVGQSNPYKGGYYDKYGNYAISISTSIVTDFS